MSHNIDISTNNNIVNNNIINNIFMNNDIIKIEIMLFNDEYL
jgi:hypothetical protein